MPPRWRDRSPRYLSLADREEISRGLRAGKPIRQIAAGIGRSPSTVSREVNRNDGRVQYRAWRADRRAYEHARRPKPARLACNRRLADYVEEKLGLRWSPQQIAARLKLDYPGDEEMRVSHETIYQTLFVQSRGGLRKELAACLRSGRTRRRPQRRAASTNRRFAEMVLISERPAEIEDRAVPGHWEGDLLVGEQNQSAISTLVERTSRFTLLTALPHGRSAEAVRDALAAKIGTLPARLCCSITWDQGSEMACHAQFSIATGVQVYFAEPHSPWQRGTNENTNGLLRQYLPKGTDLSVHTQADLDAIADQLNGRPRQTLGWLTPAERFQQLADGN